MKKEKNPSPFIEQVRLAIRAKYYSIRTEQSYIYWIKRFIFFHEKRHPKDMAAKEVREFLTYLAVEQNVAPNTQTLALNALNFLYKHVLCAPLGEVTGITRPKKKQKLPVVLSQLEISNVLKNLDGNYWLAACLRLRVIECVRLRVQHIDFKHRAIYVSTAKGDKIELSHSPMILFHTWRNKYALSG